MYPGWGRRLSLNFEIEAGEAGAATGTTPGGGTGVRQLRQKCWSPGVSMLKHPLCEATFLLGEGTSRSGRIHDAQRFGERRAATDNK